jgi:hypothetical protein
MRVYARTEAEWEETLAYFADPDTRKALDRLGLRISEMDFNAWEVRLQQAEQDDYLKAVRISLSDTLCSPSPTA